MKGFTVMGLIVIRIDAMRKDENQGMDEEYDRHSPIIQGKP
jgi:hypothetical protein